MSIGLKRERRTKNEQPNAQVPLLPGKTLPSRLPCEEPAGKRPSAPVNSPPGRVNQLGVDIQRIPIAVSYTHLDVYKRQVSGLNHFRALCAAVRMPTCLQYFGHGRYWNCLVPVLWLPFGHPDNRKGSDRHQSCLCHNEEQHSLICGVTS